MVEIVDSGPRRRIEGVIIPIRGIVPFILCLVIITFKLIMGLRHKVPNLKLVELS